MPIQKIIAPDVYKPRACHALRIGDWVYTTGIVGWRPDGSLPSDFEGQCRQLWENMLKVLAAAGAGPEHICIVQNYMAKPEFIPKFFDIRAEYVKDPPGEPPHRVGFMGVCELTTPDLLCEVLVSAYTGP